MVEDEIIIGISSVSTQISFALPAMISLASNQFYFAVLQKIIFMVKPFLGTVKI